MRKTTFSVSNQIRHKVACAVTDEFFGFKKKRDCTIHVAKTKALQLIYDFVFGYADCRFSDVAVYITDCRFSDVAVYIIKKNMTPRICRKL